MRVIIAFVVGVLVGALAALMLAPESGEDLRAHLLEEGRREQSRMKSEYERNVTELRGRLDKVQTDIHALRNRSGEVEVVEEISEETIVEVTETA